MLELIVKLLKEKALDYEAKATKTRDNDIHITLTNKKNAFIEAANIVSSYKNDCEPKLSVRGNILVDQSVDVNEYSNVKAIEQKTDAILETLGDFADWLKLNHEIEISDDLIVEYLE